jgi:hypothetical protein
MNIVNGYIHLLTWLANNKKTTVSEMIRQGKMAKGRFIYFAIRHRSHEEVSLCASE